MEHESLASRIATFIYDSQQQGFGLTPTVEAMLAIFGPEIAAELFMDIAAEPYDDSEDEGPEAT